MKKIVIYNDEDFIISQCATVDIPGYLILETKQDIQFLHKKQFSSWEKLGVLLAKTEEELYKTLKPENIYFCKFGEECKKVHFHIFPRTQEITKKYFELHPEVKNINGPQLFDWARKEFKVEEGLLSNKVIDTAKKIDIK